MTGPHVSVSPSVRFGRPNMKGISTEAVADMYWLGEDVEDDYGLPRHELLVTLWFEATYGCLRFRRRWRQWGAEASGRLWKSDSDVSAVPLPPTRES